MPKSEGDISFLKMIAFWSTEIVVPFVPAILATVFPSNGSRTQPSYEWVGPKPEIVGLIDSIRLAMLIVGTVEENNYLVAGYYIAGMIEILAMNCLWMREKK